MKTLEQIKKVISESKSTIASKINYPAPRGQGS